MNGTDRGSDVWKSWALVGLFAAVMLTGIVACSANSRPPRADDTIWDSKLLDRRVEETPRQRTMRECQQECERFRVECVFCHTTDKASEISAKELHMTKMGVRARVMRNSATFGLHENCGVCHNTRFNLNSYAQKMFGPEGEKHRSVESELNQTTIK